MELELRSYDAYNGQLKSYGQAVNLDSSFDIICDYFKYGQWHELDSIRAEPMVRDYTDEYMNEYMNIPLLRVDYPNQVSVGGLTVRSKIDNNVINLQLKSNRLKCSVTAEYDLVNREIIKLCYLSDSYKSILSFQNGIITRWIIKTTEKKEIKKCLNQFEHGDYLKADNVESLVINRMYDSDGFLVKQVYNINRSDDFLLEQFKIKYNDQKKGYKITTKTRFDL